MPARSCVMLAAPVFSRAVLWFCPFSCHTCSGDGGWGSCAQVADLKEEPHRGIQRDPLIAGQGQHLETMGGTPGGEELGYMASWWGFAGFLL